MERSSYSQIIDDSDTLDLHGVRHEDVERLLENFILLNEPPLKIITGNSIYMQTKLETFCSKHGVNYERWANWGEYTILSGGLEKDK